MIGMTLGVATYALYEVGGFRELTRELAKIDPNLLRLTGDYTLPELIGYSAGIVAMGAGFGLSQPHVTVRIMAGKDPKSVRKAKWIYMAFVYGTWGAMIIFGICSRLLLPSIADPEQALPIYAMRTFDPWIIGLVLAGVFSTIASSADSQILTCSSAISRDLSPQLNRTMTKKLGIRYQQLATALTGIVAAIVTIYLSSSVFELVVFSISVLSASIGSAMLIAILGIRTNAYALSSSMIAGVSVALSWRYLGYHNAVSDVLPGFITAVLTNYIISNVTTDST